MDVSFSINLNQVNGMGGDKNFTAYMKVKQAGNGDYGKIFFLRTELCQSLKILMNIKGLRASAWAYVHQRKILSH